MTLHLKRETLTELDAGELAAVAGAGAGQIPTVDGCLTGVYPTLPVAACIEKFIVLPPPTE